MQAQEFLTWAEKVGVRFASDLVDKLGINRNTAQRIWKEVKAGGEVEVGRPLALAMAAVAAGAPPWNSRTPQEVMVYYYEVASKTGGYKSQPFMATKERAELGGGFIVESSGK